ncbi:hypothetical protein NLI96_g6490 [Meripilus lineatus]|uniref:DUF7598 domain-containing protein n=1 Tax=Meripilus lineatus TaxID=2056292 RepID=A0AAD5V2M0_9APHY|nr:hypothetical protein NLI96_g6490 [Physisporinus lineatus]
MLPPRVYFFFGLNGIRALSIISMLLVLASSIFVLVKDIEAVNHFTKTATDEDYANCDYIENSTVPNQPAGVFWAVVNRMLIILEVIVLILSEIGWPSKFFDTYFPVLGQNFGLGPLGIFQCLLGATILSHHVDDFTLVAAFFLFSLGCLNMFVGLIFREKAKHKRSLMFWRNPDSNSKGGILPTTHDLRPQFTRPATGMVSALFSGGNNEKAQSTERQEPTSTGFGFGRKGEKTAGLKGFLISRPLESLPRYAPQPRAESRSGSPEPRFASSTTAL